MRERNRVVVQVITKSMWKRFVALDMIIGTGSYYAIDWISSSVIIALISSWLLTELIKKVL